MANALSFPQLSLDLPSSRMSVDFSKFASGFSITPESSSSFHVTQLSTFSPSRITSKSRADHSLPHLETSESREPHNKTLSRQGSSRRLWRRSNPGSIQKSANSAHSLSRAASSASTASKSSIFALPTFSYTQSASTRTSFTSSNPDNHTLGTVPEETSDLSSLPLLLLEHILAYALSLPMTVSVGPQDSDSRHLQYRYHRAGLDFVDIRQILRHPLFLVSQHIRNAALEVLYTRAEFVLDLHCIYHTRVSSTVSANIKKHQKLWINDTPKMVKDALQNLSKLHIRLPVPSTEAGVRRGRDEDNWMDGSDGKGGGGWRIKSMKREKEDALEIQRCLDAIMKMVMEVRRKESESEHQSLTRRLSSLSSIRRARSIRSMQSERSKNTRSVPLHSDESGNNQQRTLKRLDIVLVKRSPSALILQESLDLVRSLRAIPVTGFTRYHLELNDQRVPWATKYRKRWQGMEPDGSRLLEDLSRLAIAERAIEPIQTPTAFKFVNVDRKGQLRLRDSAFPKTPIVFEPPQSSKDTLPPLPSDVSSFIRRNSAPRHKKARKRVDSFALIMEKGMSEIGSSGTETSGRSAPPTIEELKKIAEDIRAGRY
ncbi:hypothetical protein CC78DRAFT_99356 [Lojkania enalia]|uniref:Uncharacterized protein n=1 Tax=Lojkania enalia TaxID=147567 RepID=A0A9P4MXX3_9PLEO|nr:hypothetical protein CC78DRAFT_99356 [Didymosphaeria enalia]